MTMLPTRQKLITILALCKNIPSMGGDAYGMSKEQLNAMELDTHTLLENLPSSIYDGINGEMQVFLRSGLESQLGISKQRAETLERTKGEIAR